MFTLSSRKEGKVINDFGKQIKKRLIDMDKTQTWLVDEVRIRTGMYFDRAYIWQICQGKRKPKFLVDTIKEILELDDGEETPPERDEAS